MCSSLKNWRNFNYEITKHNLFYYNTSLLDERVLYKNIIRILF